MKMTDSDEETFVFALLCEEREKQEHRKKMWVYDINRSRSIEGEYHTLIPRLKCDTKRFQTYFRMSIEKFYELLRIVEPNIRRQDTRFRRSISVEERLVVTLRFLATGDSFKTIGNSFRLGYTTVQEIVYTTCDAFWDVLRGMVMPIPDEQKWKEIEKEFSRKWNYPNCVGALDGKHIQIQTPPNSGSLYFNYKKHFSIVLLALVDAHYNFIMVDVGDLGKNSDGGIFARSQLGKNLDTNSLHLPPLKDLTGTNEKLPHVIVADEAFPLKNYLMRPYPGTQLINNESKKIYNYIHGRARRVSENAFGIMCQKFRIFYRKIQLIPKNVDRIVLAICCLHNFLRDDSVNFDDEDVHRDTLQLQGLTHMGGNFQKDALQIRDSFKNYFFSPEGSVSWQADIIRKRRIHK